MKTLSVLLIEDDEIECIKFNRVLDAMDTRFNLTLAKNGEEALRLMQEQSALPDVIFLDLNMPKMNGMEFLKVLKNDAMLKYIPAMILTTSNNQNDILACYKIGIAGYILKPLRYEDYKEKIRIAVDYWEMVDQLIQESDLESKGIYTAVGTYEFGEMLSLVSNLSKNTAITVDELLCVYGEHFFDVLKRDYPQFIALYNDPLEMLSSIENHIHVEVRKIYPDQFGLGLMRKTFLHFDEKGVIETENIADDGTEVKFNIQRL